MKTSRWSTHIDSFRATRKIRMNKGFTLIELLVVIAIIGLLSSVVFAKLVDAKNRAAVASGQTFATNLDHSLMSDAIWVLDFEEPGGTAALDSSGNNDVGYISGTFVRSRGVLGNGVYLNTDSSIDSSGSYYGGSAFTVSFWVKPSGFSGAMGAWSNTLVYSGDYNTNGFRIGLENDGGVSFWSNESGGTLAITSNVRLSTKRFNHVTVTYNGTKAVMYIDGKIAGSSVGTYIPTTYITINPDVGFGRANNMAYDSFRFYNASLLSK